MKRRFFIKALLGVAAIPLVAKASIGAGSGGVAEKPKTLIDPSLFPNLKLANNELMAGDMITIGDSKQVYMVT